jgi:excisionase family DNA binding protein
VNPSPPEKRGGPSPEAAPIQTYATGTLQQSGLTIKEAAWHFMVHRKTVARWIAAGKLKVQRLPSGRARIILEARP